MIPCLDEKCLKYPVCKNNSIIYCYALMKYTDKRFKVENKRRDEIYKSHGTLHIIDAAVWRHLNETFPNLSRVFPSTIESAVTLDTINHSSPWTPDYLQKLNDEGYFSNLRGE